MNKKLSISNGNAKMGKIPSVSLPPVVTCPNGVPCAKKCYAARIARLRPSVAAAYARNLEILQTDPAAYWLQVKAAATVSRFFRYHVAGDIPDREYLENMIKTATELPNTQFLTFTKRFTLLNEYLNSGKTLPDNLKIIFSQWGDLPVPNPHNLPTAAVIFKNTEPNDTWKICGGNCAECACRGVGCWELNPGETIAFYEH